MITKRKTQLRGNALTKNVQSVVNSMLLDPEVTPAQINVSEVAKKVGCSRVALYNKDLRAYITLAQEKKIKQYDYSDKMAKARKPKLIRLQNRNEVLKQELEKVKAQYTKLEELFFRLLINIKEHSSNPHIDKLIDELLTTPISPAARRQQPWATNKKERFVRR